MFWAELQGLNVCVAVTLDAPQLIPLLTAGSSQKTGDGEGGQYQSPRPRRIFVYEIMLLECFIVS